MAVLTVNADVLAGRSLAAYCGVLPVQSIAGYCWFMSGEASRHPAGVSWVRPI
jgi:drug/metabolite transporter superfamily protein YnfA